MYTTVIFDIDGTILDTEYAVLASLQKLVLEKTSKKLSFEELSFALGITGEAALIQLGMDDIDECLNKWIIYNKDLFDHISVFEEIEETLIELHKNNISIGIVTSRTKEELESDFTPFGLEKYFDLTVSADHTEKHKPNPDPILKFIELSGADKRKSLYIGDTIYDFKCASGAGIDFALALWGCKSQNGINAKHKLDNPKQLLELLNI